MKLNAKVGRVLPKRKVWKYGTIKWENINARSFPKMGMLIEIMKEKKCNN